MAPVRGLVVMDFDGTLVDGETIDVMAELAGVGREVEEITRRAMEGELEFGEALRERVRLLAGAPASILDAATARLRLNPGVREFVAAVRRAGAAVAVVSGGFTEVVRRFARELGLDAVVANELEVRDGVLTGRVYGPVMSGEAKGRVLLQLCRRFGVRPEDTVAVGDGANDASMLNRVGLPLGFRPKGAIRDLVRGSLSDFREAIPLVLRFWGVRG
ncbi:phosphoserine phosphatase SerB [Methanopyrus sp.]|jgi:phosphoserine phosphatase